MRRLTKQRAFSLLELILVIVLLGVMAGGAGLLITTPIEAYNDQLRRQQLVDQAEMALRQIARDVRRALPNSIRTTAVGAGWALEMVNTVDGARYRDEIGGVFIDPIDDILDFTSPDAGFNLLGRLNLTAAQLLNQRLVIYNSVPADSTPNIYSDAVLGDLGVMTPNGTTLGLSDAPMGPQEHRITLSTPFQFSEQSPGQRAFVVDGPISYICDPVTRRITRYNNYTFQEFQPTVAPGDGQNGLVVTKILSCSIDYSAGTPQRGAIITLQIALDDSGETISLLHQVHVENVP